LVRGGCEPVTTAVVAQKLNFRDITAMAYVRQRITKAGTELGVPDYLASPERAVALLNTVIASGGDLKEIRQALAIVTGALERAGLGDDGAKAKRRSPQRNPWPHACPHSSISRRRRGWASPIPSCCRNGLAFARSWISWRHGSTPAFPITTGPMPCRIRGKKLTGRSGCSRTPRALHARLKLDHKSPPERR
jgi:hypothetical protein